ncbi:MAG: hypothetical protein M1837_002849 [Sclerophora amabilis]|nr:MAG: hypothetical protein M1837_002849 [Sclerophora amabilis]
MTAAQSNGTAFAFVSTGAAIQEFSVAGHNIVLNFSNADFYLDRNDSYFGATIGRVANRVQGARINNLNGRSYQLAANNNPNSIHGGTSGWGYRTWTGPTKEVRDGREALVYRYRSQHGEEGYPATVDVSVSYVETTQLEQGVEKTALIFEYEVSMAEEQEEDVQETVINVTNHSYFNLGDKPTIEGTQATLATNLYLPLDDTGIPTAGPTVHDTVVDNKSFTLGEREPNFDDCFVVNPSPANIPLDSRNSTLKTVASFYHPSTKLHLEVLTTEPAFQFYTGEYIDVPAIGDSPQRISRAGFCVEPSRYVNAANVENWRNMVVLKKGQVYGSRNIYKCWKT